METKNEVYVTLEPLTRLQARLLWFPAMCLKPLGHQDSAFDGFVCGMKQCLSLMSLCRGTNNK